jgi:hypothetical protein
MPASASISGPCISDIRRVHVCTDSAVARADGAVNGLTIVTSSYRPDLELLRDQHQSIVRHTSPDVRHIVVVPRRDRGLFAELASNRMDLWTVEEIVPHRFIGVPGMNIWVNACRPWPPVRGWVMQQVAKIAGGLRAPSRTVLTLDSDILLVKDIDGQSFGDENGVWLYRKKGGVHAGMPRHCLWHMEARRLLGLPPASPPLPDYVGPMLAWDRVILQAMVERVEQTTGRPWSEAFARCLHVSELILYGVFVDYLVTNLVRTYDEIRCHGYWDTVPLSLSEAITFVAAVRPDDLSVMISAKSGTPLDVRRSALRSLTGSESFEC